MSRRDQRCPPKLILCAHRYVLQREEPLKTAGQFSHVYRIFHFTVGPRWSDIQGTLITQPKSANPSLEYKGREGNIALKDREGVL